MHSLRAVLGILLMGSAGLWAQNPPRTRSAGLLLQLGQSQSSGTDAQLRGISAVSAKVAWASGAKGTVLRTVDGGVQWVKLNVPNAEALDFRDIQAFDQNTAFVLSIGPGEQSRIYKTVDGGKSWQLQFTNTNPKAFYDCFAFWDRTHGIALSDSVDGKFPLLATADGLTWKPMSASKMPSALPSEGAFAASGTCIATIGKNDVWFATGGPAARVFHSPDRGKHWTAADTPIIHGAASQGIFSIAFWSANDGVAVGGDYKEPAKGDKSSAVTQDSGKTWAASTAFPAGYRSAVANPRLKTPMLVAVGTTGVDTSVDSGKTWQHPLDGDFNAVDFSGDSGWAVGPAGKIISIHLNFHQ